MLNKKQQLTIKHLKDHEGITDRDAIISFCLDKLSKPNYGLKKLKNRHINVKTSKSTTRKHSKQHYQGIIESLLVVD